MFFLRAFLLVVGLVGAVHGYSDLKAGLESSQILQNNYEYIDKIAQWVRENYPKEPNSAQWKLCYRASGKTLSGRKFHRNCDGKANTISILKNEYEGKQYIYGGFQDMELNFKNSGAYSTGRNRAFLYTLEPARKTKLPIIKSKANFAFYGRSFYTLMCFGLAHRDLCCYAYACSSKTGISYKGSKYLGGYHGNYLPSLVEVFYLSDD